MSPWVSRLRGRPSDWNRTNRDRSKHWDVSTVEMPQGELLRQLDHSGVNAGWAEVPQKQRLGSDEQKVMDETNDKRYKLSRLMRWLAVDGGRSHAVWCRSHEKRYMQNVFPLHLFWQRCSCWSQESVKEFLFPAEVQPPLCGSTFNKHTDMFRKCSAPTLIYKISWSVWSNCKHMWMKKYLDIDWGVKWEMGISGKEWRS